MAQQESNREKRLHDRTIVFLQKLGYDLPVEEDLITELYGELSNADFGGYSRGYIEGHAEGWEDRGREKGCNCD